MNDDPRPGGGGEEHDLARSVRDAMSWLDAGPAPAPLHDRLLGLFGPHHGRRHVVADPTYDSRESRELVGVRAAGGTAHDAWTTVFSTPDHRVIVDGFAGPSGRSTIDIEVLSRQPATSWDVTLSCLPGETAHLDAYARATFRIIPSGSHLLYVASEDVVICALIEVPAPWGEA